MSSYLIYLPGLDSGPQSRFDQCESLVSLFGQNSPGVEWKESKQPGPDGGRGFVGAICGTSSHHGIAEFQTWHQSPCEKYWIGLDNRYPPSPIDLERPEMLTGNATELLDGNEWVIPVAHWLPTYMGIDCEGKFKRTVKDEFLEYFEEVDGWYERFKQLADSGGGSFEEDVDKAYDFVCGALSMNYVVDRFIASAMRLLDEQTLILSIAATFNYVKKN